MRIDQQQQQDNSKDNSNSNMSVNKVRDLREGLKELLPTRKKIDFDHLVEAVVALQKQKKEDDPGMKEELIEEVLGDFLTWDVYLTAINLKRSKEAKLQRGESELQGVVFLYDLHTYKTWIYDLKDPQVLKALIQEILGEELLTDDVYNAAIELKRKNPNGVKFLHQLETFKCELALSIIIIGNLN